MDMSRRTETKTALACDRCRQRKSRCDGLRPRCSHCTAGGIHCHYRPTPANPISDTTLLSRLESVENRLQALQESRSTTTTSREDGSWKSDSRFTAPPEFHTGSAQQMLHSWPRLRLCFPSSTNFLDVLTRADHRNPLLSRRHIVHTLSNSPTVAASDSVPPTARSRINILQAVEVLRLFESRHKELPLILQLLLECHADFKPDHFPLLTQPSEMAAIDPDELLPSHAMALCLALINLPLPDLQNQQEVASDLLSSVLRRQWMLWNSVHDRIAVSIAISYCLLTLWARPFHALGVLQSIKTSLKRMGSRLKDNQFLALTSTLYFIIESDVLSEIDEYSTDTILSADADSATDLLTVCSPLRSQPPETTLLSNSQSYVEGIIHLRSHMNRILHLYTPVRAYARPHELADLVLSLSSGLREWYQHLNLEQHFPRDIITFSLYEASIKKNVAQRELALRYFACVFMIHRPVLYFFLHKDMEYAIQPPGPDGAAADHSPWVLESCRNCIESVALIIRLCDTQNGLGDETHQPKRYWPEYQLLFSAYLVLLQVRTQPSLEPYLRIIGSTDSLLDIVELEFLTGSPDSPILEESLTLLTTARRNFEASSPNQVT